MAEFRVEGVETNIAFLQSILAHDDFATTRIHTRFVDDEMRSLATTGEHPKFVAPASATTGGFAGARVVEQTIREKLPEGFQRAEYLLDHGMLDRVTHRRDIKEELVRIVRLLTGQPPAVAGDLPAPTETPEEEPASKDTSEPAPG